MSNFNIVRKFSHILTLLTMIVLSGQASAQIKIMPLGNSITQGEHVSSDTTTYRDELAALLSAEGVNFDFVGSLRNPKIASFDNQHEGHGGFRADQIFANINTYLGANPDIILLHIGTNDISANQTPESTRNEISDILDAIHSHDPNTKIILASLIPRNDAKDINTTSLNTLIEDLFYKKRDDEGYNLFYIGMNEVFKVNPNWATEYLVDSVHPTDTGYNVMAEAWLNAIMTAINIGSNIAVTDNFERTSVGITWDVDPLIQIQNGDLVNTSTETGSGRWKEMATFVGVRNPTSVSIKWSDNADPTGINEGGLALLLDSPSYLADGYLAWITTSDNNIRLWTISNGESLQDLDQEQLSQASPPGPGDIFRVDLTVDGSNLQFDYYVNDVFAGNITIANPGLSTELYSGVLLRHDRNNQVAEFSVLKTSDTTPPDPVTNLAAGAPTATSVPLTWTATGDDGSTGQASQYDLRYSNTIIDNTNFTNATPVQGVPNPAPSGSLENITVSGLSSGTKYYFALKVTDEAGNTSTLSNVVSTTTVAGNFFSDNFDRTTGLGANWTTDPDYQIVNNQLSNTSTSGAWDEIAVLNARKNPAEIAYKYAPSPASDAAGIDQSGFVLVFGSPGATSSGYAITRRTGANNQIRLWSLVNGAVDDELDRESAPNLSPPAPGDRVKIVISQDGFGNYFDYFINDVFDGRVQDLNQIHDLNQDNWAGVTLRGNLNNDIDDFSVLLEIGPPASITKFAGDAQTDTVGQTLPIPLTVRITDEAGSPVQGVNVGFEVIGGGGSLDVAPPSEDIIIEAESGMLTAPMSIGSDANASGGSFIHVPDGGGGANQGMAKYTFSVETADDYVIWGRAIAPDANNDVFFVIMDGGASNMWDVGQRVGFSTWKWDEVSDRGTGSANNPQFDPVIFSLSAGSHTLTIQEGKDGTKLDQIVITRVGSGFQPPANDDPVQPTGKFTDANGLAEANLTLGPMPGINTVDAMVSNLGSVTFTATGVSGSIATIAKISGDGQVAPLGSQLPNPFVVELRDEFGNIVPNQEAIFSVIQGNGTLVNGLQIDTVVTDLSGQAQNTLTLATNVGVNQVQVTAQGYTGADIIFTANAEPGNPTTIALLSGNNQTGTAGKPLTDSLKVLVTDNIGTPVPGVSVTYDVTAGGGNVDGLDPKTLTTNNQGVAAVKWTLGISPGATNTAQATSSGLSGSPVQFTATAAVPKNLEAVSALTHSGTANVPLADSIAVRVKDAIGAPLPAYPVEFAITAGGGMVNNSSGPVTVLTNNNGIAQVQWSLGSEAGTNNNKLRATSTYQSNPLVGSPIDFIASSEEGPAANFLLVSGNNQTGLIQNQLDQPFVVKVTDANNNPVPGWPVTFKVVAGGGSFNNQSTVIRNTDSDGLAQATLTLGSTSGPDNNQVEASAENDGPLNGSPIVFTASATASSASDLIRVAGNNQSGAAGEALPQKIQVKVTDDVGNAIPTHPVRFRIIAGGGTINGATAADTAKQISTNASGIAEVTWYLGGVLGGNAQQLEVRANDGLNDLDNSPMIFQATATAGAVDPDASTVTADVTQLPANGQDRATITVTLTDKFGNPIPGKAITITSTGMNNFINQPQNLTDAEGKAVGSIASTNAEVKSVSATVIGGVSLNSSVDVTFTSLTPRNMILSGGNNQSANVGTAVEEPIQVKITDINNNPVPGITVNFQITGGNGFFIENSFVTDQNGVAGATWVLGPNAGTNTARASASFNGSELLGSPVNFTATGVVSTPTTMVKYSGDDQTDIPAGSALPQPLEVQIIDNDGKPVSNVDVNFNVVAGGGAVSNPNARTNYAGIAQTAFTLGPIVGTNSVEATNAALSGSPVPFTFESVVGPPAILAKNNGDGGSAPVNTVFPVSVKITDSFGNPVSAAHANFQVIEGGGVIESQDDATNSSGLAEANIRLPETVGEVKVKATSNALPNFFVNFTVMATSGTATTIAEFSGNNQDGTVGRELVYPLMVKITDVFGNPVAGEQVTWVTQNGNSVNPGSSSTDENGIASTILTIVNSGNNQAAAIRFGLDGSPVNFVANGVANKFPLFSGLKDTSVVEGDLLQFQVNATDDDGDPVTYEAEGDVFDMGANFNSNTRTFSWTPTSQQSGEYDVTFVARDNKGGLDSETITVTVRNSNNPPVITAFTPPELQRIFVQGEVITFSVTVTDEDNDPISYEWRRNGALTSTSSQYVFTSESFDPATYIVTVVVDDGEDSVSLEWHIDLVTSVELASFAASFNDFDGIKISWVTSREIDNVGFDLLRGVSNKGPFTKLNTELLPTNSKGEYGFTDRNVEVGMRYFYVLEDIDVNGVRTRHGPINIDVKAPETFDLSQNYPNPFNPETKIRFQLPKSGQVVIKVFDVLGREVRTLVDGERNAGFHEVIWNARDHSGRKVSSGIYYYQITSGEFRLTKKMLLMK